MTTHSELHAARGAQGTAAQSGGFTAWIASSAVFASILTVGLGGFAAPSQASFRSQTAVMTSSTSMVPTERMAQVAYFDRRQNKVR
jgi:hypothetical protein